MDTKAMKTLAVVLLAFAFCPVSQAAREYTGPRPPQPDIPYLIHADNLIPTEVAEAQQENRKNDVIFTVSGAASSVRTPLAEPAFLFLSGSIAPDSLELFRFEVKNGNRQLVTSKKSSHPLHLTVTKLDDKLYRIEVDETLGLAPGEYALSPSGSNQSFCFQVY
jgi:hypothetical protein